MKKNIIIATLVLCILALLNVVRNNREEQAIDKQNIRVLNSKVDSLKTKNGEWIYKTEVLQYNLSEMKAYNKNLLEKIKEMNIKPGKVKYVSTGEVVIHVSDTVYLEADDYGIYSGEWKDTWTSAYFEVQDSILKFDYTTQDSLMLILYGQKEKFNIWHPFRKRLTSYYSVAKLTRPNSTLIVKSIKFK